ncbi:hypothetical protein ACLKA6_011265 [Drosophila palustris]
MVQYVLGVHKLGEVQGLSQTTRADYKQSKTYTREPIQQQLLRSFASENVVSRRDIDSVATSDHNKEVTQGNDSLRLVDWQVGEEGSSLGAGNS